MIPGNFLGANPKTTINGIVILVTTGYQVYHNPAILSDPVMGPVVITQFCTGLGMVFARDSDSKAEDPIRPPTIPPAS